MRLRPPQLRHRPSGSPASATGAVATPFSHRLAEQARERHERILLTGPGGLARIPPSPPGFDPAEFIDGGRAHGFMTVERAAETMACSEADVVDLVERGLLEWRPPRLVRPAIVTVLAVKEAA